MRSFAEGSLGYSRLRRRLDRPWRRASRASGVPRGFRAERRGFESLDSRFEFPNAIVPARRERAGAASVRRRSKVPTLRIQSAQEWRRSRGHHYPISPYFRFDARYTAGLRHSSSLSRFVIPAYCEEDGSLEDHERKTGRVTGRPAEFSLRRVESGLKASLRTGPGRSLSGFDLLQGDRR